MKRDHIPAQVKRAVLVEAGHRCAISTCRATTTEIAHIVPWAKSKNNSFENLIALCPSCHTRFDQKKEIDEKSIRMYKQNLSILNNRYGEIEIRLFEILATSKERVFVVGLGGDLLVANAVKDGFFEDRNIEGPHLVVEGSNGYIKRVPMSFAYWVTDVGVEFIEKYALGLDITSVSKKANQSNKQPIVDISDKGISVVEIEKNQLHFDIPYRSEKNANAHSVKFESVVILKKDDDSLGLNYNEDKFLVLAHLKDLFPDNVCLTYEIGRSISFSLDPGAIDCLSRMYICVKGSYKDATEALNFEVFDVFKYSSSSKFWVRLLGEEDIAVRKLFDKLLEFKNSEEYVGD
jgi:hypothetical protein